MLATGIRRSDSMKQGLLATVLLAVLATQAQAGFQKDREAFDRRQAELDQRCESAREAKLAPLREAAFQDCMRTTRNSRAETECRRKTAGENGNRAGGAPRFYDLPACVEAFEHKRQRR
ncbi:hypothetical protein GFK97_16910 [Pseudomonas stutzeri]|uniref:hypothetical protein n=1 Tax=Stutzerimonas stutzeri TaxID=316 RepID=UPI0019095686|nr:hypothetical protein [Stutzerimonas stutzeri]MBK3882403.1 hypothetical protein [Stutzerimonas stutzeri]